MSQLRAPAARTDRREGGRHGRPAARPATTLPETHIRPQLLRLAVLPPIAVALAASAAVLFAVRSTGARSSLTLWGVLAGAVSVALAAILIAAVAADRAAKSVNDRIGALRRTTARGEADLRALVEALRRGDGPPQRTPRGGPPDGADDFDLLAADLARAHDGAVTAVVQATQLSSQAGSEQKLEVFLNLARRLQSLVHREISILDELENEIEDPDLLKGLFHVDHLATRIRRHAENLAVLGGAVSRRQWSHPVPMTEVLRSAIAEVEQYSRVKLVPPIDGTLRGHAVADVIHLLAELVENATVFSAPHTQVLLRANLVTSGLAVEVEDRGLGMPVAEQNKMNALLTDPDQVNVGSLLADGRIGLFVVSQLARRHGINVRLQTNIYGGVQAVLVVPQGLLGAEPGAPGVVPGASDGTGVAGPGGGGAGAGAASAGAPRSARGTAGDVRPSMPVPGAPGTAVPPRQYPQEAAGPGALGDTGPQRVVPGAGPAVPLPVRGSQQERPNPAEAVPGIRPDDRPLVAQSAAMPPTPRTGTVRGTMGKPQLPRRRAQEHIAPQLRDGPAAPRPDAEYLAGHDPGLMAAFQRGIGLAEAQQHMEAETTGGTDLSAYAMGATHMGAAHMETSHMDATHLDAPHTDASHTDTPPYKGALHMNTDPITDTDRSRLSLTDTGLTDTGLTDTRLTDTRLTDTGLPPTGPSHLDPGHTSPAHARPDHTPTRHDGSASAG